MRKIIIIIGLVLLISGCSYPATNITYQVLDPLQLSQLNPKGRVVILDVRTELEYSLGHIPSSINIPLSELKKMRQELFHFDDPIVVYCHSGNRSEMAAKKLISMGYTRVYDMGGILDWPYPKVVD